MTRYVFPLLCRTFFSTKLSTSNFKMAKANDGARQYDVKSLKRDIRSYVQFDLTPNEIAVMGNVQKKEQRGFNNPIIAQYLIPVSSLEDYRKDPEA